MFGGEGSGDTPKIDDDGVDPRKKAGTNGSSKETSTDLGAKRTSIEEQKGYDDRNLPGGGSGNRSGGVE